jgi:hypothetical protein
MDEVDYLGKRREIVPLILLFIIIVLILILFVLLFTLSSSWT